jgi:hypothetical protein
MMTNLVELKERNTHIANIINAIRKDPDRKIIVLSQRIDHLKEFLNDGSSEWLSKYSYSLIKE